MSSTTRAGVGVVVFGGPHPSNNGPSVGRSRPEISGDVVVVDTGGDLIGLDLATGARRWLFDSFETNPIGRGPRPGPCVSSSKAVSASRILVERTCTEEAFTTGGPTVITSIDPSTGRPRSELPLPDHPAEYVGDLFERAARWSGPTELNCGISVTGVEDTVVTVLAGGSRTEPPSLLSVDLRQGGFLEFGRRPTDTTR